MKKTIKSIIMLLLVATMLVSLTACGNKLVATKTNKEMGMTIEETVEIKFKDKKASETKITYEFFNSSEAIIYHDTISMGVLPEGVTIERKDKSVIVKYSEEYYSSFGDLGRTTKAEIKEDLEKNGYIVK